jgi:hypothetical protein
MAVTAKTRPRERNAIVRFMEFSFDVDDAVHEPSLKDLQKP